MQVSARIRNNVKVVGAADGPVVMLAHGFGCDQDMWARLVPFFATTHRLVLFDHVGAGGSDPSAYRATKYASLGGYAADLVEVRHTLRQIVNVKGEDRRFVHTFGANAAAPSRKA